MGRGTLQHPQTQVARNFGFCSFLKLLSLEKLPRRRMGVGRCFLRERSGGSGRKC